MKKIIFLILSILLLSGCNERDLPQEEIVNQNKPLKETTNDNLDDRLTINIKETTDCTNALTKYYEEENRRIYLSCLDEIILTTSNNKDITLKYYLQNINKPYDDSINSLVDNIDNVDYFSDGGTKLYKTNKYAILLCNTLDGNKDIYIGNKNLRYKSNYCEENNNTFTRTYTIKKVENYTKQQYENGIPVTYAKSLSVTLSQFQGETKTVIINNPPSEIRKNKTYEFEFMLNENSNNIEDTIESIFKNAMIIDITKTDKTGLSQKQDEIK